jgi:hypothetical protein
MTKIVKGRQPPWRGARDWAESALSWARASPTGPGLLGIYLNDHLAGATAGMELARRMTVCYPVPGQQTTLVRLADEIVQDRQALLGVMAVLEVPVRRYKVGVAWTAEKAGRLKLNGSLVSRSPLSNLEELEMLRLGVEGKAAGWRTLRELAEADSRLNPGTLDGLILRAREQAEVLEDLRIQAAARLIGREPAPG